jgi:hypothetical protein
MAASFGISTSSLASFSLRCAIFVASAPCVQAACPSSPGSNSRIVKLRKGRRNGRKVCNAAARCVSSNQCSSRSSASTNASITVNGALFIDPAIQPFRQKPQLPPNNLFFMASPSYPTAYCAVNHIRLGVFTRPGPNAKSRLKNQICRPGVVPH